MGEIKTVKIFDNRFEAEIAIGLLNERGIEAMIAADDCGGQLMGLTSLRKGGVKLLVREDDIERAEEALKILELN